MAPRWPQDGPRAPWRSWCLSPVFIEPAERESRRARYAVNLLANSHRTGERAKKLTVGGHLSPSVALVGSWGRLGAVLGRLGAVLGGLGAVLGRPGAVLGRPGAV